MKSRKAAGPSSTSLPLIAASGEVGIQVMAELCQSSGCIWNAIWIVPKHSGSNLQVDG